MGFWASLGIAVTSGIGAYFAGYLREKGKNLATRQDIDKLTRIVEDIKTENALLVEQFKSEQQLRYAALDRRLEAHQRAFELWNKLKFCVYRRNLEEIEIAAYQCVEWWAANCLYLEPDARIAFSDAYGAAMTVHFTEKTLARDDTSLDLRRLASESILKVEKAGDIIMGAVALPGLTKTEATPPTKQ